MKKILSILLIGVLMFSFLAPKKAIAQEAALNIQLPAAQKTGGMPLMEALNNRYSERSFSKEELSEQVLSNLLWAAWGYNRPEKEKRTAPSSMNKQEISLYCALEKGLYLYNAKKHELELVKNEDIRSSTGKQLFVNSAPLNLVFVANTKKQSSATSSAANVGFISQNVYLFCASEGLGTVVRGWFDADKLHKAMGLEKHESIILCQTVGYPKK
jgi:SagB-type dehydrogenase family enzyme